MTLTKADFLTVRWNNILTLALGVPTFLYVIVAFSTTLWTETGGLVGLALFGVVY